MLPFPRRTFFLVALLVWFQSSVNLVQAQPVVSVTHSQSLAIDSDSNGEANPGDTIEYTVAVQNTGTASANNLVVVTTLDANTEMVPGSFQVRPLAAPDALGIIEDSASGTVSGNVLTNDAGQDGGETLTVTTLGGSGSPGAVAGNFGTLTWTASGSIQYTLASSTPSVQALSPAETLTESFPYTMTDGTGFTNSDTLTVTITGANDAPTAVADTFLAFSDFTTTVNAANGVLTNDTDIDGDALTVTSTNVVTALGNAVTFNANGSFTYTGTIGIDQTDTFSYTVADPNGGTGTGSVTVTGTGKVWFVSNTSASGNGSFSSPFPNFSDALAVVQPNDYIYVFRGDGTNANQSGSYNISTDGLTILGQGVALTLNNTDQIAAGLPAVFGTPSAIPSLSFENIDVTIRGIRFDAVNSSPGLGVQGQYYTSGTFNVVLSDLTVTNFDRGIRFHTFGTGTVGIAMSNIQVTGNTTANIVIQAQMSHRANVTLQNSQISGAQDCIALSGDDNTIVTVDIQTSTIQTCPGFGVDLTTTSSAALTVDLDGTNTISGNGEGVVLRELSGGTASLNVTPATGTNNSITSNTTGVCNEFGVGTLNINPSSQVSGNTTNISVGTCGG